jgi:hypothetical protein
MDRQTAHYYKELQGLLGPIGANWLDSFISSSLARAQGASAASIAYGESLAASRAHYKAQKTAKKRL